MARTSYRPLAGCKLFHDAQLRPAGRGLVTVPLRGVSCFGKITDIKGIEIVTVPLRGVSCFRVFVIAKHIVRLPSPCGV